MTMQSVQSSDLVNWSKPEDTGVAAFHGAALTVYRGELWGAYISTQRGENSNKVFLYKYVNGKVPKATSHFSTPKNFIAIGRVSIATIDDKFYLAYRGARSGKYWLAMSNAPSNSTSWKLSATGTPPAPFVYSPAISGHKGDIHMFGVTGDGKIWWQVFLNDGTITHGWSNEVTGKTTAPVDACSYQGTLRLCNEIDNGTSQSMHRLSYRRSADIHRSSKLVSQEAMALDPSTQLPSLTVWKDDQIFVVFRGASGQLGWDRYGNTWVKGGGKAPFKTLGALGCASFDGKIYVTYAERAGSTTLEDEAWANGEGILIRFPRDEIEDDDTSDDSSIDEICFEKQAAQAPVDDDSRTVMSRQTRQPHKRWYRHLLCI